MVDTVAALYRDQAEAQLVVDALKRWECVTDSLVTVIASAGGSSAATDDSLVLSITASGVDEADAATFAAGVRSGASLVSAQPLFGRAFKTVGIMSEHAPIEPGVRVTSVVIDRWTGPAPWSRFLGWPVLTTGATPLSSKLGWQVLSDDPTPLSSKFGWRVLSDDAFPFSTKFKWRLLWDEPAPLSAKLKWPVLRDDPTPLSSKFKWPVLLDEAAPFSAWLGWGLLLNDPAPLSSWLKIPLLTKRKTFLY